MMCTYSYNCVKTYLFAVDDSSSDEKHSESEEKHDPYLMDTSNGTCKQS